MRRVLAAVHGLRLLAHWWPEIQRTLSAVVHELTRFSMGGDRFPDPLYERIQREPARGERWAQARTRAAQVRAHGVGGVSGAVAASPPSSL
jgi:hypothetical protein